MFYRGRLERYSWRFHLARTSPRRREAGWGCVRAGSLLVGNGWWLCACERGNLSALAPCVLFRVCLPHLRPKCGLGLFGCCFCSARKGVDRKRKMYHRHWMWIALFGIRHSCKLWNGTRLNVTCSFSKTYQPWFVVSCRTTPTVLMRAPITGYKGNKLKASKLISNVM